MIKRLLIIGLLLIAVPCFGANVYIDLGASYGTDAGTFDNPYNSISDISGSISASNDYYFRCGSSQTTGATWTINTVGTSTSDRIIFSAYYDSGGEDAGTAPTGSAVLERDNPTFGQLCGNGDAKPILQYNVDATTDINNDDDTIIQLLDGGGAQYLEFSSLQFRNAGEVIFVDSGYNLISYNFLYNVNYGFRLGTGAADDAQYNTVEYNWIEMEDNYDEDGACSGAHNCGVDAIHLGETAQYNTVRNNYIEGFDHGGVFTYSGDYNTIEKNHIKGTLGHEDYCMGDNVSATGNVWRFNLCENAGMGFEGYGGADDMELYGNIFMCGDPDGGNASHPQTNQGCVELWALTSQNRLDGKIYNNVIYDNPSTKTGNDGLRLQASDGGVGTINGLMVANNVIYGAEDYCIRVQDIDEDISNVYFYNNACYNYDTNLFSMMREGGVEDADATAAAFETTYSAIAAGNLDQTTNPDLNNVGSGEFWPENSDAGVVGAGCDMNDSGSNCYDAGSENESLLDPDNTDFTASPPVVYLETQPAAWIIGAYNFTGSTPDVNYPLQGVKLNGAKYN